MQLVDDVPGPGVMIRDQLDNLLDEAAEKKLTLRESLDTRLSTQIADLPSARRSRVTGAALALPSTDG